MMKKMLPVIALITITVPISILYFCSPENNDLKKAEQENTFKAYQDFLLKYPETKNKSVILEKMDKAFLSDKNISISSGKELFEQNCSYCHLPTDKNFNFPKKAIPLIQASSKLNKGWISNALSNPQEFLNNYRMPIYNISLEEASSIESYILENSDNGYGLVKNVEIKEELVPQGKILYEKNGCNYCHGIDGKNGGGAPNLDNIAIKENPSWTFNWLKNPYSYHPNTIMPPNSMSDNEILSVVSWLHSLKSKELPKKELSGNSKDGKDLLKKFGCASCHNIIGVKPDNKNYPNLFVNQYKYGTDVISIMNSINNGVKNSAMPSWKSILKEDEIKNITAYIKSNLN